ncbi:undecaprenyl-diphosphatase/undecaprenyl-diphosphatase [Pedococcus cremeus]|uniref:Undecaprenyl-diphosphatase/undecaprenyl-diphosphatase n=1 Tax=Pedococcus cremeus TaxID=587636 RepID=A0A1H9V3Z2_9MICO|nr:phosphatase PAP2 family protein [Pedococcus cremeus]SES16271.1 undecaprenyl-diphosphatase/undecaprenyl-diphosphatase [Pedococcus cremeus]
MNTAHRLDDQLLLAANGFARDTPGLHGILLDYGKYGLVVFAALLLAGLVAARGRTSTALAATGWAAVATLLALAVNQPLGHLVAEARPYVTHPTILRLADRTADFSFPSDHAVMAGAVAAGLTIAHRRLGALAWVAAVLMAFTRVYIGAHYPWDVAAGLVLGSLVALLGWLVLRRPLVWLTARLREQPGIRSLFGAPHAETSAPAGPLGGSVAAGS